MKLRPLILGLAAAITLTGCFGERVTYDEFQTIRRIAMEAHRSAERAEARAQDLEYQIDELESRLDYICSQASRLCY